jgi:hypothetical protein
MTNETKTDAAPAPEATKKEEDQQPLWFRMARDPENVDPAQVAQVEAEQARRRRELGDATGLDQVH